MAKTLEQVRPDLPHLAGPLPGARARAMIDRDAQVVSPSYTRCYPLVVDRGEGAMIEDVDKTKTDFSRALLPRSLDSLGAPLKEVLVQHAQWIHSSGKTGKRAELARFDLTKQNLEGANLLADGNGFISRLGNAFRLHTQELAAGAQPIAPSATTGAVM